MFLYALSRVWKGLFYDDGRKKNICLLHGAENPTFLLFAYLCIKYCAYFFLS